tara:strand:+ start:21057 stop:21470 length:414 start_codon:yes stop_codon:yes gene_type:complete
MAGLTISKVAKAAGVGVETIRFYERKGLVDRPIPQRTAFREYPPPVVDRIRFIKRAQTLGFTLSEISELLELSERAGASRKRVKELASQKLAIIREKLSDLIQMEITLATLVEDCSGHGPVAGCPIIDAITDEEIQP